MWNFKCLISSSCLKAWDDNSIKRQIRSVDRLGNTQMKSYVVYYPIFIMLAIDFAFAISNILLKKIIMDGMNHLVFITYRQAISTIFLAPVAFFLEKYEYRLLRNIYLSNIWRTFASSEHATCCFLQEHQTKTYPSNLLQPFFECHCWVSQNNLYNILNLHGCVLLKIFHHMLHRFRRASVTQYLFLLGMEYTSATFSCAFLNMVPVVTFLMALPFRYGTYGFLILVNK